MGNRLKKKNKNDKNAVVKREQFIDQMLMEDNTKEDNEYKLLLLGPGESGKSTILQQIQIIHQDGFKSKKERSKLRDTILQNLLHSIHSLIKASVHFNFELESENQVLVEEILNLPTDFTKITNEHCQMIQQLWKDKGIQETYKIRHKFHLFDCAKAFLDDVERILDPDYIPTVEDIVQSRSRTTGITDIPFSYGSLNFRIWDVGGQRNERRKWIHCFQSVTVLLFVVSLSEYDQNLFEDSKVRRMQESLLLFDEICNSRWFRETNMVLFLNKDDLFRKKIQKKDLTCCFKDYEGGCDYDKALEYIKKTFLALNQNPENKTIFCYTTCATETNSVDNVFKAVKETILSNHIKDN
ncbi:guanine nucleotide-binding protein g(o) subunit alpha [Anaeramoeba flamelloides]|uniref:Guanine nucleotide-binding protein g(O) subunit alpha n=1 Tax=Anaeramoeba flamelloides TaxID=1746091 RepID=A0AAV7YV68_9EUKA|nr:guanine nucleotide-binding protein g(o) subunit alpha [Anaeramoeba flamelloides]KAJ6242048.1 guanine nucleotide-binding protein g(o) subunit alpha [Anaeramoeba flamelloides]